MGGLGEKVGSACEEFEDSESGVWVTASESSGIGSPR